MTETPQQLVELAATAGELMIASGAETHRVEDTISRILATSGYAEAEPFVLPTGVTVSLSDGQAQVVSVTRRVKPQGCDLARICATNRVSRDFCEGKINVTQALSRLEQVKDLKSYPLSIRLIGTMLVCGGFAFMFGGTLLDALAATICGLLLGLSSAFLTPRIGRAFVSNMISCFLMTAAALTLTYLGNTYLGLELQSQYLIVGGMMPVVPGVAITNAIRDILGGDYMASLSRAVEAFLTAASVALGVGCAISLGSYFSVAYVSPDFAFLGTDVMGVRILFEAIAAFLGSWGFCWLLNLPRGLYLPSSFTAVVCWMIYLAAGMLTISTTLAVMIASAAVYMMSYMLARREKEPVLIFLIVGILPLVPGFAIYRSVYYMITGTGSASDSLVQTLTLAGAIALGIFFADTVNLVWKNAHNKHKKGMKNEKTQSNVGKTTDNDQSGKDGLS